MRILHVIPAVAPRYGGTSAAICSMARSLRELQGLDIELATTDADGPKARFSTDELPEGVGTVHLFRRERSERLKYSRRLSRWLKAHAGDYHLLHIHSNWNYPVAAACGAAYRAGVPFVLSPHGMLSAYSWGRSKWSKRIYWPLVERGNVRRCSAFHVTSEEERKEVLRLGVRAPVEVIALGVDEDAFEAPVDHQWLRRRCPESNERPMVLFLSRLHPKKGIIDFLLPAFAQIRADAFLAIAGGDDVHAPGYTAEVKRAIRRLGLERKVALLGAVPANARWAAFDGADLFVLPSHGENFGIVVPEAMARGKPVVVTTCVQFAGHVATSQGGSVVPPDVRALTESLDHWLGNPRARAIAGELGSMYIRRSFSWSQTAEALSALYERVFQSNRRAPQQRAASPTATRNTNVVSDHAANPHI